MKICLLMDFCFILFWLQWLGLGIMAVGVWAWKEKDTFNNLSRLTNVALDPAFILILVGKCHTSLYTPADAPAIFSNLTHRR